jgi:hypothetical protein
MIGTPARPAEPGPGGETMGGIRLALTGAIAAAALAADAAPAAAQSASEARGFADRQAIEAVLVRYTTGLDTLNADLYASCFTEDAEFGTGDNVRKGRAEIRKIITGLIETNAQRAANRPAEAAAPATPPAAAPPAAGARPAPPAGPPVMHHVMTNAVIELVSPTEARHHSYWMTVVGSGRSFTVAGMGRYEDVLVKQNGQWLIKNRKLLR